VGSSSPSLSLRFVFILAGGAGLALCWGSKGTVMFPIERWNWGAVMGDAAKRLIRGGDKLGVFGQRRPGIRGLVGKRNCAGTIEQAPSVCWKLYYMN
jgi:hypothetical protein